MALGGSGSLLGARNRLVDEERATRLRMAEHAKKEQGAGASRSAAQAREKRLRSLRGDQKARFATTAKVKAKMDADLAGIMG